MRVATRRLRAVLEIFAPCVRQGRAQGGARATSSALADALGARRDPDVAARGARRSFAAALPAADRARDRGVRRRACAPSSTAGNATLAAALQHTPTDRRPARHASRRAGRGARHEGAQGQGPRPGRHARRQRRSASSRVRLDELLLVHARGARPGQRRRRCTTCASRPSACATSSSCAERCFGPYAATGAPSGRKELQDLLGRDPRLRRDAARASLALGGGAAQPRTAADVRAPRGRRQGPRAARWSPTRRNATPTAASRRMAVYAARRAGELLFERFLDAVDRIARARRVPRPAGVRGQRAGAVDRGFTRW